MTNSLAVSQTIKSLHTDQGLLWSVPEPENLEILSTTSGVGVLPNSPLKSHMAPNKVAAPTEYHIPFPEPDLRSFCITGALPGI